MTDPLDLAHLDEVQAAALPADAVAGVMAAIRREHERLGRIERALLARWTGEKPAMTSRPRGLWLRVGQVAAEYGVKPGTVYDWVSEGRVTTKKIGSSKRGPVLIHRPSVEKLARTRRALRSSLTDQ